MAFHVACARVATCRATQALSSSWAAPRRPWSGPLRRAHPFTGLRARLLGPGVSLGLHSAEIEARRCEFTGAVMMRGYDRVASPFTPAACCLCPASPAGLGQPGVIRARVSACRQP